MCTYSYSVKLNVLSNTKTMDHILNLTWDLRECIVWYSKVLIFPLKFYVNKKTRVSCCSAKAQRLTMHLKSFSCFSRDWLYIVRSVLADKTTLEFAFGRINSLNKPHNIFRIPLHHLLHFLPIKSSATTSFSFIRIPDSCTHTWTLLVAH